MIFLTSFPLLKAGPQLTLKVPHWGLPNRELTTIYKTKLNSLHLIFVLILIASSGFLSFLDPREAIVLVLIHESFSVRELSLSHPRSGPRLRPDTHSPSIDCP